jgi:hypothetical protein
MSQCTGSCEQGRHCDCVAGDALAWLEKHQDDGHKAVELVCLGILLGFLLYMLLDYMAAHF